MGIGLEVLGGGEDCLFDYGYWKILGTFQFGGSRAFVLQMGSRSWNAFRILYIFWHVNHFAICINVFFCRTYLQYTNMFLQTPSNTPQESNLLVARAYQATEKLLQLHSQKLKMVGDLSS